MCYVTALMSGPATQADALLLELAAILRHPTLALQPRSQWHLQLLPQLRALSCVSGVAFPPEVRSYVEGGFTGFTCGLFFEAAVGRVPYGHAHADPYIRIRTRHPANEA